MNIDGWECGIGNTGTRWANKDSPIGSFHIWLQPDGSLETEFRPSEPDDNRTEVRVPSSVVSWLFSHRAGEGE